MTGEEKVAFIKVKGYEEKEYNSLNMQDLRIVLNLVEKQDKIINEILEIAFQYGQIDGEHHKSWVIDQIVRKITGKDYGKWVAHYEYDEETDEEYEWDIGIAP